MVFNRSFFDPGPNSKGLFSEAKYKTSVDNRAAVQGAGYFNSVATELSTLDASGFMFVIASDASVLYGFTVAAGVVTLDTANSVLLD